MKPENIKILVIDDEEIVCSSCNRLLSEEGYVTMTTQKSKEGLEMIKKNNFDIVITDLKMPEMTGMDILNYIKEHFPGIQVIMITGYSTIANAVASIKNGAFDYLPKPFSPEELLTVVQNAIINRLQAIDKIYTDKSIQHMFGFDNIIGNSESMTKVYKLIEKVGETDSTVLITGESGTGKELIARAIHNHSNRRDQPYITIDCSTLADSILESELFGHEKGAFTGASAKKKGIFEIAHGGTLFLDEVSNISLETQSKLLRVLETGIFRAVGAEKESKVNIRLICATNKDLKVMVKNSSFRQDLFYRLNVFSITVPPLKERKEDIPILAYHFLKLTSKTTGKHFVGFSKEATEILINYEWSGNVRELKNIIERIVVLSEKEMLSSEILNDIIDSTNKYNNLIIPMNKDELKNAKIEAREKAVVDIEKMFLLDALIRNQWNVSHAAEDTGMQRTNFQALMKKYNIKSKEFKESTYFLPPDESEE